MSKFTVKDLGLEYRMTVGGALIQQTTRGLEYQNYPLDNTFTRHCELSVEGYALNEGVDYEGLLEDAEATCYETTELIRVGLKIIDLKQLGRPIGFTKDKLGAGELFDRGFWLDLSVLGKAMDYESVESASMYNSMMDIIRNENIETPINIYSEDKDSEGNYTYDGYISQKMWDFRNPVIAFIEDIYIAKGFKNRGLLTEVFKNLKVIFSRMHNYDLVMLIGNTTSLDGRKFSNVDSNYVRKALVKGYKGTKKDYSKGFVCFCNSNNEYNWINKPTSKDEVDHFVVNFSDDSDFDCDLEDGLCTGKCNKGCKGCCVTGMHSNVYRYSEEVEFIGTDYEDYIEDCDCEDDCDDDCKCNCCKECK